MNPAQSTGTRKMCRRHILATVIVLLGSFLPKTIRAEQTSQLEHLYQQASDLMSEGDLVKSQELFDRAFAMPDVTTSDIYPLLLNEQGTLMLWRGERRNAINAKRTVIPHLKAVGNTELDISVYSDLGFLYHRSNMTDSAIIFHEKADSAARVLGDLGWLANVTQNIGVMYHNLKRYDDAARFIGRAARYSTEAGDAYSIICSCQLLAIIEVERGDIGSATTNARRAWLEASRSGDKQLMMRCIPSLYRVFEARNMPDSVDHYMDIGEQLYDELPQNSVISLGYVLARARMHFKRRQWREALHWHLIQSRATMQSDRLRLLKDIAVCYRNLGDHRREAAYLDSALTWTDSLARTNQAAMIEEFSIKHSALEKEIENSALRMSVLTRERMILAVMLAVVALVAVIIITRKRADSARREMAVMQQRRQLEISRSYIEGLEDERKYFAKELHDGVANDLLGIKMCLSSGECSDAESLIDSTRDTVRHIARNLMPPEFDRIALTGILSDHIATLNRDAEPEITFTCSSGINLQPQISREIYRMTQEALMNLLQHGNATHISVALTTEHQGKLELKITDNSTIEPPHTADGNSRGIGMRTLLDRAKSINATMSRQTTDNVHTLTISLQQ